MKIAVLLATYNGEKYIQQLLDSLLNQSIQIAKNTAFKHGLACVNNGIAELLDVDYQIYIHDDGSSDGTNIIISEYGKTAGAGQRMLHHAAIRVLGDRSP